MASIRRTRRPLRLIAVILAVSLLPLVASSNAEAASPKRVSAVEAPPLQSTTFRSKTPEKRVPDKAFVPSARGFKEGVSRQVASSDSGKVFRNADGTTTAFIKPESFNGPRADRQKMTPLKREANGSFGVTRGDKKLDLNAKSSASHVKLSDKTSSLSFGLAGAQIRDGQQVGESVEYLDVAPGIDLVYSMTPSGLKEIIRVKSPQGIRDSYRFDLNTSGLKASVDSHANIVFVSDSGTKVAMIPPGVATDSGPDAFRSPSPVGVRLADNNTAIEVVPDAKWMRDSARTFPLLVDPTVIFGAVHQPAVDTTISNLNTTTNYDALQNASGEYITNVGHCPGMGETYGYMRWDLSLLAGHNVTSAELQANVLSVQNPNPANSIKMWRTIQPWDSTTFTWAQMTQGYGNHGTDKIVLGAPAVGAHGWDVTPWVQNWNNGTWANHGVSMDTGNLNTCYSLGAQGTGSTNYAPILVVNASNSAPTNVSITTPADNGSSVSAWPTFSATATDAESDPIKYQYQVSGDDTFTSLLVDSPNAGPTWTSNVQLDNGRTYWLRVIAKDDPFGAQSSSPVTRFTVNFGGGSQPIAANDNVGPVAVSMTSGNVSTSVSSPVANTLGGGLGLTWTYNSLDTGSSAGMPRGWAMSPVADTQNAYSRAKISNNAVTLMDSSGVPHAHTPTGLSGAPGNSAPGFKAPAGDTTQVAETTYAGQKAYSATETDGSNFIFNQAGQLRQVTNPNDDGSIGSATFHYDNNTASGRLTSIVDTVGASASPTNPPASSTITFTYHGQAGCPAPPHSGFDQNPTAGLLCKVKYFDSSETHFFYVNMGGHRVLQRVVNPGAEVTNFAYEVDLVTGNAWLERIMDPLQSDAVAFDSTNPLGAKPDYSQTGIAYNKATGRATTVLLAAPDGTNNTLRTQRSYAYGTSGSNFTTTMTLTGMTPAQGFTSKITYNAQSQVISSIDAAGIETQNTWDSANRLLTTTNMGTGRKSSAVYDERGFQTDAYGPAAASCFNGQLPTAACSGSVPHTSQVFDSTASFKGLGVTYWANTHLDSEMQSAASHATGVGTSDGSVDKTWGTTLPTGVSGTAGWSARLNGGLLLDAAGDHTFGVTANDGVRLWVDDKLVIDKWNTTPVGSATYTSGPVTNAAANTWHKVRIDYRNFNGSSAQLKLQYTPPNQGTQVVPGSKLRPNYGLVTKKTSHDSGGSSPTSVTDVDFIRPEYGQVSGVTQDPGGLGLTTSYTYDNQGGPGHWFKLTSKTLPGGNTTNYSYFGDQETPPNYCNGTTAPSQRGLVSSTALPAGSGGAQVTDYGVYDVMGRTICARTNSNGSIKTDYDSRGRIDNTYVPGTGSVPGRYTDYNYAVGGDPRISSVSDTPDGGSTITTTTKVDMLGRVVSYTDAHNSTTNYTYDQAGHQVTQTSPSWGDYRANVFNASGQLIAQHGGHTSSPPKLAEATYSPTTGELTSVNYPGGTANAGNNTTATFSYDASTGLPTTVSYNVNSGGLTVSDTQTYSRTGRVLSATQAQAGSATSTASSSYSYDAVGRLTFASVPGKTLSYSFGSTNTGACSGYSGINTNAGKNTNRTSVSDSVLGTRYYCYDNADRLIATSDATYSSMFGKDSSGNSTAYDDRGNTVSSDPSRAMVYDLTNRHVSSTSPAPGGGTTSVSYTRDGMDRIISRTADGDTIRYSYSNGSDAPEFVIDAANNVVDRFYSLIGGVRLTKHYEPATTTYSDIWNYSNLHGDTLFTTDGGGTKTQGPFTYDPDGGMLSSTKPDNSTGNFDFGYLGSHFKGTETQGSLNTIEMGARQYVPGLARFLSVDPVDGGSANSYDYVNGDPVNLIDPSGNIPFVAVVIGVRGAMAAYYAYRGMRTAQNLKKAVDAMIRGYKATSGQRKRLEEHLKKLEDYRANPGKFDNTGRLRQAGNNQERRQSIINGRIRHLEKEIDNFVNDIDIKRENRQ